MYPNDPGDHTRRYERGGHQDDPQAYSEAYPAQPPRYAAPQQPQPYQQPYPGQGYGPPPRRRTPSGPRINVPLFAGGVVATALVTGLAAWLVAWFIREVFARITEQGRFGVWNPAASDPVWFGVAGAICAILAGVLWYLLQLSTPAPSQFYGWIVGLLVIASIVSPLLLSRTWDTGIATAVVHLVIGVPILGLIRAVGAKSIVR